MTGFVSVPVAAMASSATSWQTTDATAASMIHLICLRTSRAARPVANRQGHKAAASSTVSSTVRLLRVPIKTVDRTGPSDPTPSGFATISESPPGAGSAISLGCTTNPAIASVVASTASPANGRQRGDGSVPDGNSSSMKPIAAKTGMKLHSASRATISGAGKVPGWLMPSTA